MADRSSHPNNSKPSAQPGAFTTHPAANGAAEAAVKAMKALILKTSSKGNLDLDAFKLGLLEFRSTPRAHGSSPAELLYGRALRSHLLAHPSALQQQWREQRDILDKAATSLSAKAKARFDQHTRPLPSLAIGSVVRVQHPGTKRWNTIAEIIEQKSGGRSYAVRTESGRVYWRNRRFLRHYSAP